MPSLKEVLQAEMSPAEKLAALPKEERDEALVGILDAAGIEVDELEHFWPFWARPKQMLPANNCQ